MRLYLVLTSWQIQSQMEHCFLLLEFFFYRTLGIWKFLFDIEGTPKHVQQSSPMDRKKECTRHPCATHMLPRSSARVGHLTGQNWGTKAAPQELIFLRLWKILTRSLKLLAYPLFNSQYFETDTYPAIAQHWHVIIPKIFP